MQEAAYAPSPTTPPQKKGTGFKIATIVLSVLLLMSCCGIATLSAAFFSSATSSSSSYGEKIALIHLEDMIMGSGSGVIPEDFQDAFSTATDDPSIKAIVLRIDSPGGTVAASEEIASYVENSEKPVVVSVGDMCASGAYMIASQADSIVAMPGSSVGSIGVIMEIPNVSKLLEKLGLEMNVIKSAEDKDTGSPYRPLTAEELAALQADLDEVHSQFVDIVAKGRDMDAADVQKLATGEVFLGSKAVSLGLIDKTGTLEDALDVAADLGGIEGDDYTVVTLDKESFIFDDLFQSYLGLSALSSLKGDLEKSAVPVAR